MKVEKTDNASFAIFTVEKVGEGGSLLIMSQTEPRITLLLDKTRDKVLGAKLTIQDALNSCWLKTYHPEIIKELSALSTT